MFLPWTPPPAEDGLTLTLVETRPRDPEKQYAATYHFAMVLRGQTAGSLRFRAENVYDVESWAGHIGYGVFQEFRGRHLAERACRMIVPLARAHGFTHLWITCAPGNLASRRTCERLGAVLVEIAALPESSDIYQDGERWKCRYRWAICDNAVCSATCPSS